MAIIRSLSDLGGSISDLEHAATERFADAEALFKAERFATAIAYGLYALEIELKVVICRRLDLPSLPKAFQTHNLRDLLILTGLSKRISEGKRLRLIKMNWEKMMDLPDPDKLRYSHDPKWDDALAQRVLHTLSDRKGGLIPWLRKQALNRSR